MRNFFNRGRFSRSLISVGLGLILGTGLLSSFAGFSGSSGAGQSVAYAATSAPASTSASTTSQPTTVTQYRTQTVTPKITGVNQPPANSYNSFLPSATQLGLSPSTVLPLWQSFPSGAFELDTSGYGYSAHLLPNVSADVAGALMSLGWWVNLVCSRLTILILVWAFKMNLLSSAIGTITSYSTSVIGSLLGGPTLVIVTLLIGAYALYRGIIQYKVGRMLRSLLASVIVLGFAFGYVGHLSQYITAGSNLANSLSGYVMSTIDTPLIAHLGSSGSVPVCVKQQCGYQSTPVPNTCVFRSLLTGNPESREHSVRKVVNTQSGKS